MRVGSGTLPLRPVTHYTFDSRLTTISLIPTSNINPAYLVQQHQTLIDRQWNTNHHSQTSTASAVMHSVFGRLVNHILGACVFTSDRIRLSSRKGRLCGRNWSKIWHAHEECPGGKVSSQGAYKKVCSFLCSFINLSSHSLSLHSGFCSLSKSFVTAYDLIAFSCFFDNFSLSKLFVPIKVPCCQATGNSVRCA